MNLVNNIRNSWIVRYCYDWETVCLKVIGQQKYNESRHLPEDFTGTKDFIKEIIKDESI